MAVRCPAGQDITIRFDYMTPGLIAGLWMTGGFAVLFLLYLLWIRLDKRRHPEHYEKQAMGLAEEDFLSVQRVMEERPASQGEELFLPIGAPGAAPQSEQPDTFQDSVSSGKAEQSEPNSPQQPM